MERLPAQTRDPFGMASENAADLTACGWVPEKYLPKRGSKKVASGHAPRESQGWSGLHLEMIGILSLVGVYRAEREGSRRAGCLC